ncbi:hypothetical protein ILP92_17035 [Maribius pontilimi]|uniref:DUF2169 domain-containing protein n=1 Tax=Palleronia pontilimi TaxID=1964209 RepID=A0A934IK72_9RHOB|nr:hypothetical protein [Palleronia pontilimi]MBJ3764443.1 hypothetical protein [Palleronia pontilimi]
MIVEPAENAPPHFFLIGVRAPNGGAQDDGAGGVSHEDVGTIALRAGVDFSGAPLANPGEVATDDAAYADMPDGGPFRHEADIATYKPRPDVIVVDDLPAILTPLQMADLGLGDPVDVSEAFYGHLAATNFGTVRIDRGAGFGAAVARPFGWANRGDGGDAPTPGTRQALAGTHPIPGGVPPARRERYLAEFNKDGGAHKLPIGYDNAYQNGGALPGEAFFAPGDRLRFDELGAPPPITLTIPAAPPLTARGEDGPLDPPLPLTPLVDTVVMDRAAQTFTLIWRATFPWEARLETARLEVG